MRYEKLYKEIIQLQKDIRTYGMSFPLNYIKPHFIEKLELELEELEEKGKNSSCDLVFKKTLNNIRSLTKRIQKNICDYNSIRELKNAYSEAYLYAKLKSLFFIEGVQEDRSSKSPDFKIKFQDSSIYLELKSLNMVDGDLKDKEITETALANKIEMESQMKNRGFASVLQRTQPYLRDGKNYNPRSQKMIIETLIEKSRGNLEEDQFKHGDTILLIDLSDQLPVPYPDLQIRKEFEILGQKVSGALWYAAFGQPGDAIYKLADSERDDYIEVLEKEGILRSHSYVKGLIFHTDDNFYSLARAEEKNANIISLMEYLSPKTFSLLSLLSTLPDIPEDFADMDDSLPYLDDIQL